jgi:hypothetical protein
MRRSTKRRLIPLALALVVAMVGAALAVPSITVNVQQIGAGASDTMTTPVGEVDVNWNLDQNNPDNLASIEVKIDSNPGQGTLYVKFYRDNTLKYIAEIGLSSTTDTSFTIDGSTYQLKEVSSGESVSFPIDLHSFDVNNVKVVYIGPRQ